jgi:iron complex transport system ATP-binding protein
MKYIEFLDLSFSYPLEGEAKNEDQNLDASLNEKEDIKNIFEHFTAELPPSFVSLIGPNGSGKTTLMLLASGRLLPTSGTARLFGIDTKTLTNEEERNLLASFIYQNMELETDETVGDLLQSIFENGQHPKENLFLVQEAIDALSLEASLEKKLSALSKGEMQRSLIAFSILYGSRSIFMDEPLFALEYTQKEEALSYIQSYSRRFQIPVYIAMHELELSRKWADNVLLIFPNRDMSLGSPEEVLTAEDLEKAYGIPAAMLKESERLTQRTLLELQSEIEKNKDIRA